MKARIFKPSKTAMQSGRGKTHKWVLEFEPAAARGHDPLMGWTSSTDMNSQVRLHFATREAAVDYAERKGIDYEVQDPHEQRFHRKAYADNFRWEPQA